METGPSLTTVSLGQARSNLASRWVAHADVYRGRLLLFQGRSRSASRVLIDAALTLREHPVDPSWCLALAAEAYALPGRLEETRSAATEARNLVRRGILAFEADERRALAWVDAQDGRISSAVDQLWAGADLAASRGQLSFEAVILEDLLRLGEHRAARRSLPLADQVDGAWSARL